MEPALSKSRLDLGDEQLAPGHGGNVRLDGNAATVRSAQQLGERRDVSRAGEHRAALVQELLDDGTAKALGTTGDDRRASSKGPKAAITAGRSGSPNEEQEESFAHRMTRVLGLHVCLV